MKHQYFGDINDYRKYGLLRILAGKGEISTAVCWMLTESDNRSDGKHISYLDKPNKYRKYDPGLFDTLNKCVHTNKRNVELAEQLNMIPGARYFSDILKDGGMERKKYFDELKSTITGCDLVFFDQDNGMEIKSVPYGKRDSSKYLYWSELIDTYNSGHSVLVYQHYPRRPRAEFRNEIFREMCQRLSVTDVMLFNTSNVVFVLIPREEHRSSLTQCALSVEQNWGDEIQSSILRIEDLIREIVPGDLKTSSK